MSVGDDEIQRNLNALRDGSHIEKIVARVDLARIFEQRGMLSEAIELLETNARLGVQTAALYSRLARLYRANGNEHGAMYAANEASKLQQQDAPLSSSPNDDAHKKADSLTVRRVPPGQRSPQGAASDPRQDTSQLSQPSPGVYLLSPANLGKRWVANLLDDIISIVVGFFTLVAVIYAITIGNTLSDNKYNELSTVLTALVFYVVLIFYLFYDVILQISPIGTTFGKRIMQIRVVTMNGDRPGIVRSLARSPLRVVSRWVPLLPLVVLFSPNHRALHDFIAGTMVVEE